MNPARILVVDDERSMREFLQLLLEKDGHQVVLAASGEAAFDRLDEEEFDLVITDLKMPGVSGLDVVARCKQSHPQSQVIVITAFATTETAIEAMKRGAYDYVMKPFKVDALGVVVQKALEKRALLRDNVSLRKELEDRYSFGRLLGKSQAMQRVFDLIAKVAPTRTNVLVYGESGTGKELVARALHYNSPRKERPLVVVNCGAIPDALMESELFGHEKGAFTGAIKAKQGMFEHAHGSSILLDEIGELPLNLQVKLLRVLQEKQVKRVGGLRETDIDVRVVAATNRRLEAEIDAGRFREDLFYRLNVIQIELPPLRARREDIPLLTEHFLNTYREEMDKDISGFSPEAMQQLLSHSYPGNVRELANLVERAVTLTSSGAIQSDVLPLGQRRHTAGGGNSKAVDLPVDGVNLEGLVGDLEKRLLIQALQRTGGVRKAAAKLLHISFRSIRYRMEKYRIDESEFMNGPGGPDA